MINTMKKQTLLLGIVILLSCSVYTQNWVEFSPGESTKPALTVSISNDTLVKFNVTIPGVFDTLFLIQFGFAGRSLQ
jgi:hypothetical protein